MIIFVVLSILSTVKHRSLSPPGSGKTTHIRNYCHEFIRNDGFVKLFGSELDSRKIFEHSFGD